MPANRGSINPTLTDSDLERVPPVRQYMAAPRLPQSLLQLVVIRCPRRDLPVSHFSHRHMVLRSHVITRADPLPILLQEVVLDLDADPQLELELRFRIG